MSENPSPYRRFVSYIDKSREYYLASGYNNPYRWAHHQDAPFTPLRKPLAECRLGLVTTASVVDVEPEPFASPRAVHSGPTDPAPAGLYTENRFWDKEATHTRDLDSFAPIHRLQEAAARGRIGSLSPRFYCVPTEYSQRKTIEVDAPQVLDLCREDGVEVAMLAPLCPVCHQTVSLTARHLEAEGIPTVIAGAARDIVEQCGVPRFVFTDFPLGNPCGMPYDVQMQTAIVGMALDVLETARFPRTTVQTPFQWPTDDWRENFMRVDESNREALVRAGDERRAQQARAKAGVSV
jgi:hypothetical protein